ncbi:MAG: DUF4190 domain-containing protein, partial [Clostridia bacterium]|nr:DUF4190 domain-containing protein [Clostridia bacterium]
TPPQPEPPKPRFDPETGRPLTPPQPEPQMPPQPQRLDSTPTPGYIPPQPGQDYTGGTQNPTPPPAPDKPKANGFAIGSLICGLVSLICCCCGWLSLALGIAAVILAVVSKKGGKMSGMALGGMICGIIGGGIALISVISSLFMTSTGFFEDLLNEFSINHGYEEIAPGYDIYDFFE